MNSSSNMDRRSFLKGAFVTGAAATAAATGAVIPNLVQGFSGVVLGAMLIPLLRRVTPPAMRL